VSFLSTLYILKFFAAFLDVLAFFLKAEETIFTGFVLWQKIYYLMRITSSFSGKLEYGHHHLPLVLL
jgi:hypothetical protein